MFLIQERKSNKTYLKSLSEKIPLKVVISECILIVFMICQALWSQTWTGASPDTAGWMSDSTEWQHNRNGEWAQGTVLSASLALCFIELTHIWKPNSILSGSQCSGSPELGLFSLGLQLNLWRESAALNEVCSCVHSRRCWLDYIKWSGGCYGVWRTKQPLLEVTEFYFHNVPGDAKPTFTIDSL